MKQVADKMNISVHTLRFYANQGLFPNIVRDKNGVRLFSEGDLDWVHIVKCLRETGMPINEVRHYVDLYILDDLGTAKERYEMILAQKEKAQQEIKMMLERIDHLDRKAKWYEAHINADK